MENVTYGGEVDIKEERALTKAGRSTYDRSAGQENIR